MESKASFIDLTKAVCCALIIGSHSLPIFHQEELNFFYGQWLFRFCVPFFFIVTGYFFKAMDVSQRIRYIGRIILIYIVSTILYIPQINKGFSIKMLLCGYYHLWYLMALIIGLNLYHLMDKLLGNHKKIVMFITMIILGLGIILDEWHTVFNNGFADTLSRVAEQIGGSRNGLFFAFPMLTIGGIIRGNYRTIDRNKLAVLLLLSFVLGFCEAVFLRSRCGIDATLDVTFFGWTPAIPLFLLAINKRAPISALTSRLIRKTVDIAYIIHVWIIVIVRDVLHMEYELAFVGVLVITCIISVLALNVINDTVKR